MDYDKSTSCVFRIPSRDCNISINLRQNQDYNSARQNIYTATMSGNSHGITGIILNMALGREKVLVPSAALIPLYILANSLDLEERKILGQVLSAMNKYYDILEGASHFGSEMKAFEYASQFLK